MKLHTIAATVAALALATLTGAAHAFNPVPEPPGFGIVSVNADQTIRLNVVCWEHVVDDMPPRPCSGEMMFHDMVGNIVA